ncbi:MULTISPECIES: ABC transporter substrate-binding protein [unclassified Janibacter]|uniref:ABC transporter substrate-binding protein n=1 Tax=unclassified Janibacter TaxID=2649294 RepID=UPI003CFC90F0
MRRSSVLLLGALAAGSLTLSACGSDSLSNDGTTPSASVTAEADAALADKVPADLKEKGTLKVGTDSSYAPNEFLDPDGKTIVGFDIDLFTAVAAKLGLKAEYETAKFDSIITGVESGKYDIGVSSFTINDERKKQVNMISYYSAGTSWAGAPGNPKDIDPTKPCGLKVAVQQGTVQQEEDLPPKEKACKAAGNPIDVQVYEGQDEATAAVAAGKADAMLADSPIVAYAAKESDGKVESVGDIYDAAPYGYVVPKEQTELADLLAEALTSLKEDGGYEEALTNWGVEDGAIDEFAVNP